MALNIGTVMHAVAGSIRGLGGLNVYAYPPASAQPPFAFLDMPDSIDYDLTMGRGSDASVLKLFVGVAGIEQMGEQAAEALFGFAAGSGPTSLKAAIEGSSLGARCRVTTCNFETIGMSAGNYAGLILTITVAG